MLERLRVRNLAIVEEAEAAFGAGLNVITGETGAGKSVLMGALQLSLGARADASAVRDGAREARIEATFRLKDGSAAAAAVAAILEGAGLPPCEEGVLVARRTILAGGGGRVHVNDAASTVQTLRALGRALADVHGPGDHQSLLDERFQRRMLDAYGKTPAGEYAKEWEALCAAKSARDELLSDGGGEEECTMLRDSVAELDAAELSEEDETELPARHAAAAHAADVAAAAAAAQDALSEGEVSAANALVEAGARIREMQRYHAPAAEWAEEAERLVVQAQELSRAIGDSVSRIDADPAALEALDARLSLVQRLKRKYRRADVAGLLELREARSARLAALEGREERLDGLEAEVAAAEARVRAAGAKLSAARAKAAAKFAAEITKELRGLGFLKAGFAVKVEGREPDAGGCDAVDFRFAPNPGEPERPLKDIASTGEVARVMLAVKAVAAAHDSIPVLVFDEIDSNIGGETGRAVGEKLRAVARHRQTIAITHLPQSAVYGGRHFLVAKSVEGGRTRSTVRELEGDARAAEIARMLGGEGLTSVVGRHARELLALAAEEA